MNRSLLTVVVTTHAEGRLLRPTLRSVSAAINELISQGEEAELLLVCDKPDERTKAEVQHWLESADAEFRIRAINVGLGESGASRNAGANEAAGEYVAFVDGDDLVSVNYFTTALATLRSSAQPMIVHPEYVISFGARSLIWRAESARQGDVSYRDLIRHNLWPSSAVTRRDVYLEHPYRSLPPSAGYGPEDWIWNIDTSAAGIAHEVARGTVFFYRVQARSGVNHGHSISILPSFDVAGLRRNLPLRPSPKDDRPARVSDRVYRAMLPAARFLTAPLSFEAKHGIYRGVRGTLRFVTGSGRKSIVTPVAVRQALQDAVELEPAISWTGTRIDELDTWVARDDGYAEMLDRALLEIGDHDGAVVAVPWLGVGGADLVALNYAKALQDTPRFAGRTTILGTFDPSRTVHDIIPGSLRYVHLDPRWLYLPPHVRQRFIAQLVVLVRPELIVCVNSPQFVDSLSVHARQIADGTRVYATLFAFDRIGPGYPTNPITDDSERRFLDDIDGLITDNSTSASLIDDILALPPEKILVHRQSVGEDTPQLPRGTRAYNNEYFSERNPFLVVWPHRLDGEKRPDVLPLLARELEMRGLPVRIEVWGQRVLTGEGDSLMRDLAEAGVVYRGPYRGGLAAIETYGYHALLLTSQSEGLPLVLVESLMRGLPVVATRVGGVPDIIVDGVTGLLATGPDDVAGLADAIERLAQSVDLRRSVIESGYAFAVEQHSWAAFGQHVDQLLHDDGRLQETAR